MDETIELTFKLLNEDSFKLTLSKDIAIEDLKNLVHIESGIDPSRQRLIHQGQLLKENKKLCDYPISNNHTIHIAVVETTNSNFNNTSNTNPPNATGTGNNTGNNSANGGNPWTSAFPFLLGQMQFTRLGTDQSGSNVSWDSSAGTGDLDATASHILNGVVNSLLGNLMPQVNATSQQNNTASQAQAQNNSSTTAAQVVSEEPASGTVEPDEITDLPENMDSEDRRPRFGQMFMGQVNGLPVTVLGGIAPVAANLQSADTQNLFNSLFGTRTRGNTTQAGDNVQNSTAQTENTLNVTEIDYSNPAEYHNQISTTISDAINALNSAKTRVDDLLPVPTNNGTNNRAGNVDGPSNTYTQGSTIYVDSRSLSQKLPWQTLGQLVDLLELETGWRLPTYYQLSEFQGTTNRWNPPNVADPMALFINIFQQSISISLTVLNHVAEWQKSASRLDAPTLARSAAICSLLASISGNLSSFLAWLLVVMSRSVDPSVLTDAMAWSDAQPQQEPTAQPQSSSNSATCGPIGIPATQSATTDGESSSVIEFEGIAGTRHRTWTQSVGSFTKQLINISDYRGKFSDIYRSSGSESFF